MNDRRLHSTPLEPDRERRHHQRRHARRIEVDLTVQCSHDGERRPRRATNLSTGGLYLRSGLLMPVGARPLLEFRLPGDERPICCVGEIRNQVDALLPGMNVAFSGVTLGDRVRLEAYVDSVAPRKGGALRTIDRVPEPAARTAELAPDFEFTDELELDDEEQLDPDRALEPAPLSELELEGVSERETAPASELELETVFERETLEVPGLDPEDEAELELEPDSELEN